jgi:hypothetical protein
MTQQNQPHQTQDQTSTTNNAHTDEATFAIAPDDPRSTQVRGGLEADLGGVNDHPTEVMPPVKARLIWARRAPMQQMCRTMWAQSAPARAQLVAANSP